MTTPFRKLLLAGATGYSSWRNPTRAGGGRDCPRKMLQPSPPGIPLNSYFPNFELGTAGVAFVLAGLYEDTRQQAFSTRRAAGARHIQSIATVDGDSALVYYREPDHKDLYYLGYCHGPRRYRTPLLSTSQGDRRGANTSSGPKSWRAAYRFAPAYLRKLTPGYWNVACQCCGSAAVTDLALSLWVATGKSPVP